MSTFLLTPAGQLGQILVGVTILMAAGCIAVAASRQPIQRQRAGELSLFATLLFLLLAVLPLPRLELSTGSEEQADMVARSMDTPAHPVLVRTEPASVPPHTGAEIEHVARDEARITTPVLPRETRTSSTPAAAPNASPSARERLALAIGLYLAGAAVLAAILLLGWFRLRFLILRRLPLPGWIERLAVRISGPTGRTPSIVISRYPGRPFCFGVLRPVVVLPADLCQIERAAELEAVLNHEFAHLRQQDGVGQLLCAVALPFLYVHPLFWWLRARIRLAAELIADDLATRDTDRHSYARHLLRLSEQTTASPVTPLGALPVFTSRSALTRRIEMLVDRHTSLAPRCTRTRRIVQFTTALLLVTCTAGVLGARPQDARSDQEARLVKELRQLHQERDQLQERLERLESQLWETSKAVRDESAANDDLLAADAAARNNLLAADAREDLLAADVVAVENTYDVRVFSVVVRKGDTLASMIRKAGGDPNQLDQVLRLNPGLDPRRLAPGQVIQIPFIQHVARKPVADPDHAAARGVLGMPRAAVSAGSAEPIFGESDLNLVTRIIDLRAEVQLAESELAVLSVQVDDGINTDAALRAAQIRLEASLRKRDLMRELLHAELDSARRSLDLQMAELGRTKLLVEKGLVSQAELSRAESRVVRLKSRVSLLKQAH